MNSPEMHIRTTIVDGNLMFLVGITKKNGGEQHALKRMTWIELKQYLAKFELSLMREHAVQIDHDQWHEVQR